MYDLQEPFRWISDVAVVEAFESKVLDLPDFYFMGDDYRYRFEIEAKRRFLDLLRERFNTGAKYNGRVLKWDTVIEQKVVELARYLAGKSAMLDFVEPSPTFNRSDTEELRERIFSISQSEAAKLGIGKGTLHYLRRRAERSCSLKAYQKTLARLAGSRR